MSVSLLTTSSAPAASPTYLQVCVEDPDEGADRRVAAGLEDHEPSWTVFPPKSSPSREREGHRGQQPHRLADWRAGGGGLRPDEAAARGLAFVDGCHASRHVAVALPFHPSHINKVPEKRERERDSSDSPGGDRKWRKWRTTRPGRPRRHDSSRRSGGNVVGQHGVVVHPLEDLGTGHVTAASPPQTSPAKRQASHLAGGDGPVPLHHLLRLQNHFLVDELRGTLHESLDGSNNRAGRQKKKKLLRREDGGAGKRFGFISIWLD